MPEAPEETRQPEWRWLAVLLVAGGLAAAVWAVHESTRAIEQRLDGVEERMARLESAVQALAASQGDAARRRVEGVLTVGPDPASAAAAALAGIADALDRENPAEAAQLARDAATLILTAKEVRTPVPASYFADAVAALDRIAARGGVPGRDLFAARLALAEYRSALESPPPRPARSVPLEVRPGSRITAAMLPEPAVYQPTAPVSLAVPVTLHAPGAVISGEELPRNADFLRLATRRVALTSSQVSGITFEDLTQTLDELEWKDVVFVRSQVRYYGGRLRLDNVRFVQCTFEVSPGEAGARFASAVALDAPSLLVVPGTDRPAAPAAASPVSSPASSP